MTEALKPCPNVICPSHLEDHYPDVASVRHTITGYSIECAECGASTLKYATEAEAIARWNTRAEQKETGR